jgi:hypothetical protein
MISKSSLMPSVSKLPESNENKIPVTLRITGYAFSGTPPRKSGPFGAAKATTYAIKISSALWRLAVKESTRSCSYLGACLSARHARFLE